MSLRRLPPTPIVLPAQSARRRSNRARAALYVAAALGVAAVVFVVATSLTVKPSYGDGLVPGAGARFHTPRPWTRAEPGRSPRQVVVSFRAPDPAAGARCRERHEAEVFEDTQQVRVEVLAFDAPAESERCPQRSQRITATLDAPLGHRLLVAAGTDVAMRNGALGLRVVPESTPCGRADCSTPSPEQASCTGVAIREAIQFEIDLNAQIAGGDRCDGSFLVTDIDLGSLGCAPAGGDGASACHRFTRGYLVANAGQWRLVTYGPLDCADVLDRTGITFSDSVCSGLADWQTS